MRRRYTLTIRREGETGKQRFATLAEALDVLETELRADAAAERRAGATTLFREYDAVELVTVRAEVSGRGVHAGVDLRGDGSAEAFTGRIRRSLVAQEDGESPYAALRRFVGAPADAST